MYFLIFLIVWTHFLQTSQPSQFLVFDETYFQNNNSKNDLVLHKTNTINFTFNFIANHKEIENPIFILPTNIVTMQGYNSEKHDKLIKNLVTIKNSQLIFYFKKSWSQNHFDLFCGCLSYAQSKNNNVIIPQSAIKDLLTFIISNNNQQTANNIKRFSSTNERQIPINIVVDKRKKEELQTIYNFFNTEQEPSQSQLQEAFDTFWKKYENDNDNKNIAQGLNNAFAHYLETNSQEEAEFSKKEKHPIEMKILVGGIKKGINFYKDHQGKIHFLLTAAQLYSSYSLLKSQYQSIGSLKSFPRIPKTTPGKVKALWNIYSVYSSVGIVYGYLKTGFNWLKNKVYGTAQ